MKYGESLSSLRTIGGLVINASSATESGKQSGNASSAVAGGIAGGLNSPLQQQQGGNSEIDSPHATVESDNPEKEAEKKAIADLKVKLADLLDGNFVWYSSSFYF